MWLYTVGHAQLVLRSVRDELHGTRVEILFKGVQSLDLPTALDGLTISRGAGRFLLSGTGWDGHVEAAVCFAAEDDGEYYDPSSFASSLP